MTPDFPLHWFWLPYLVIPERVTSPRGVPPVNVVNLNRPHSVRRLRWWRTRRVGLVPIREQSRSGNCLSRLPSCGRRRPRVFRFGGNHSPRDVKLRRVGPIAFASVPGPSQSSPSGSPGDRRDARRGGGRGVTFRSEGEGTRWDRADAVTGRGSVPPVMNPKERKYATPLSGGAHFGGRDGSGTPRRTRYHFFEGKPWGGTRALLALHRTGGRGENRRAFARALWIGLKRPGTRHALRGLRVRRLPGSRCV